MSERRYSDGYRKLRPADEPRRIAYEVLHEVATQGAFANIILPKALRQARREGHFSDRDAAFTSELVHGTLRAIGRLDWVISRHIDRPLADLDPRALVILRMGAHQLLDMRVPDHAAVSATVDVAREHLTDGPVRFVNAVLRSITREEDAEREAAMNEIEDPDEALGVRYSHPAWMVRAFRQALEAHGYSAEELEDVLAADNEVPTVTLVARPGLMSVDELADEAEDILDTRVALGAVSPRAVLLESGDPARLPSIRDGRSGAQDEGSQLAALIAAHAPLDGGEDARWLDPPIRLHRGRQRRRAHLWRGRHRVAPGILRPCCRRRPLLGYGLDAQAPRVALEPYTRRPRGAHLVAGAAAGPRGRADPPRRCPDLYHLFPARGRDARPGATPPGHGRGGAS